MEDTLHEIPEPFKPRLIYLYASRLPLTPRVVFSKKRAQSTISCSRSHSPLAFHIRPNSPARRCSSSSIVKLLVSRVRASLSMRNLSAGRTKSG